MMEYTPRSLSLFIIATALLAAGCDSPPSTQVEEEPQGNNNAATGPFFSYTPDSIGPLLAVAIDTLQQRNEHNSFVGGFIEDRGLPVWDGYHRFSNAQGEPILRVPVRDAHEQSITGLIDITVDGQQPHYRWIARGTRLPGLSPQSLETIFWGYENQVFGRTHTGQGARIRTKVRSGPEVGNGKAKMKEEEYCTSTCVGSYCGDWECEGDDDDEGGGFGGGDDGGFGGSGDDGGGSSGGPDRGGGGGSDDNGDSNREPKCDNAVHSNVIEPPGDHGDPSNPNPPPCEEEEDEEDGNNLPKQLDNDFVVNADTTDINCSDRNLNPTEKAWCTSSVPKGEMLNITKKALDNIAQRGPKCAEIAKKGRQLLKNFGIRYYADPNNNKFSFGGKAGPDLGVLLQKTYIDNYVNRNFTATDVDGSKVKVNFEYALTHEIEHAMGRDHIMTSNGKLSEWMTSNVRQCSGIN